MSIKYHELSGRSARHRTNYSAIDNSMITVYDYDLMFLLITLAVLMSNLLKIFILYDVEALKKSAFGGKAIEMADKLAEHYAMKAEITWT